MVINYELETHERLRLDAIRKRMFSIVVFVMAKGTRCVNIVLKGYQLSRYLKSKAGKSFHQLQ